ncbi:MAG: hypothetical protein LBC49_02555 [Bacteroidales bacterium]|jgi:hypothetical protein|nr:hypothetical protein [Bacteroidales bacterium]
MTPSFSKNLFWDVDVNDLDMEKHKSFIVARVLDYGTWDDWKKMKNYYGLEELGKISQNLRSIFPESLSFISTVTNIPQEKFRCYTLLQSKSPHWNF